MTREELLKIAKPILFNTDMVKAILDVRKTVTRRVLKHPFEIHPNGYITKPRGNERLCPYEPPYQPGDILYVRETWNVWTGGYIYKAWSEPFPQAGCCPETKWHPSIHMPKEAARIFLKVKDVRVERLQDIDDKGAYEEGAGEKNAIYQIGGRVCDFVKIWNKTIKKTDLDLYGWEANPWVWVIEFEKKEI